MESIKDIREFVYLFLRDGYAVYDALDAVIVAYDKKVKIYWVKDIDIVV